MTQYNAPFDQPPVVERRTSGLAIASLVCSLLGCCPFVTSLLGLILGIAALATIGRDPAVKGKGLAGAGIVLGLIGLIAWTWISVQSGGYLRDVAEFVEEGPETAMNAVFADDADAFRAMAEGDAAAVSDAEIQSFKEQLSRRYGAFVSADVATDAEPPTSFGEPVVMFPYEFEFENATVPAVVEIAFASRDGSWPYNPPRIVSIRIEDEDLDDLVFPAPAESPLPEGEGDQEPTPPAAGEADEAPEAVGEEEVGEETPPEEEMEPEAPSRVGGPQAP